MEEADGPSLSSGVHKDQRLALPDSRKDLMGVALAQHPVVNPERRQSMCPSPTSAKQASVCVGTMLGTTCAYEKSPACF